MKLMICEAADVCIKFRKAPGKLRTCYHQIVHKHKMDCDMECPIAEERFATYAQHCINVQEFKHDTTGDDI
jgi:hypothetical protein